MGDCIGEYFRVLKGVACRSVNPYMLALFFNTDRLIETRRLMD